MAVVQYNPGAVKYLMGLAADDPPTTNTPRGSHFFEIDTGLDYIFDGTDWQLVSPASPAAGNTSLGIMEDWDESDRAKVNVIVGQAGIAAGTGVDGVTVPRVSLATNVGLPTGLNVIGKTGVPFAQVHGTLDGVNPGVLAAAGNYDAGEVISNDAGAGAGDPWLFTSVVATAGSAGRIETALLECSEDSLLSRVRLWLFNAVPTTSEMDDNSTFNITAADRAKYVGKIDFPAFRDAGDISVSEWEGSCRFTCTATANLWGIMQLLDAETLETAGMTLRATLDILRY